VTSGSGKKSVATGYRLAAGGIGLFVLALLLEAGVAEFRLIALIGADLGLLLLAAGATVAASAASPPPGRRWLWGAAGLAVAAPALDGLQRLVFARLQNVNEAFDSLIFQVSPMALYTAAIAILGLTMWWLADRLSVWNRRTSYGAGYRRSRALAFVVALFLLAAMETKQAYEVGTDGLFEPTSGLKMAVGLLSVIQIGFLLVLANLAPR
jgi:hypothetical protein